MGLLRAPTQEPCGTIVTGVRTGGMRECRVHLMLCVIALISSAGTSLSTVLDCWSKYV